MLTQRALWAQSSREVPHNSLHLYEWFVGAVQTGPRPPLDLKASIGPSGSNHGLMSTYSATRPIQKKPQEREKIKMSDWSYSSKVQLQYLEIGPSIGGHMPPPKVHLQYPKSGLSTRGHVPSKPQLPRDLLGTFKLHFSNILG